MRDGAAEAAPKLQPLTTPVGFEQLRIAWGNVSTEELTVDTSKVKVYSNPVLTNKPDILHSTGDVVTYTAGSTWKSNSGEVCNSSCKPYEISQPGVILNSLRGETHLNALSELQMDVIVHCKEADSSAPG